MRERMKKFFMAGIFLLFLIVLTIPAESQAAVRYNLIKDVTSQETPEGQLIDVAGKKRYLLNSGTYLKISGSARMQGFIILTDMGMLIPDGLLIREINIFYGHPERFIREAFCGSKEGFTFSGTDMAI